MSTTTEADTFTTTTQSNISTPTYPLPVIVGCSVAAFVTIIIIIVALIICWKSGRCCKCKKNESVIEQNEMYGRPVDYSQYDKDEYDTKAVDNNDYYDSE